jgi:NitT/TauT family transport system substrate-binding protein
MLRLSLLVSLALSLSGLPTHAEEIVLSGPPIWESAPLIELAKTQPVEGTWFVFKPWANPEQLRKMVMENDPLLAVAPTPTAAIFSASGIELQVVSATVTEGSVSLIGRGDAIARLADLAGQGLALPFKGYLPDLMMRRIEQPGPQTWQPAYTGSLMAGMQLLLAGKVDTAMLAEPMATLALGQDKTLVRRADLCKLWRDATALADCPPAGVVIANPAFGEKPEVRTAYRAAFERLANDPSLAAGLLAQHFPEMASASEGFGRIKAIDLPMPQHATVLRDFYRAILDIEPAAVGGGLPKPDFFGE